VAAAAGTRCAAVPTTLSGAEMNGHHRTLPGHETGGRARPQIVVCDPELLTQPLPELAATALNALAHVAEALVTPRANPIARASALEAAGLIVSSLSETVIDRDGLALAGLLAGYATALTGFAVHHVVCQTIVRTASSPHAQTNAVVLPHSLELLRARAPAEIGQLDAATGDVRRLVVLTGNTTLADLGVDRSLLEPIAEQAAQRPELAATPGGPPNRAQLGALLESAWCGRSLL
jgi:maleylacetate reductase